MSLALSKHQPGYTSCVVKVTTFSQPGSKCSIATARQSTLPSGLSGKKKPGFYTGLGCPREWTVVSSRGQSSKMNVVYTSITFIVMHSSSFCQRLLGVRPGNMKTLETELTLSMMRPAGREQIKRIDVKIRYSNHSSPLLTSFHCCPTGHQKGKCGLCLS